MSFIIVEKPLHGKISEFSKDYGTLKYTPKEGIDITNLCTPSILLSALVLIFFCCILKGFMGTDFFTFKLQLGSLSSILATIAITVDDDLTKAKKIAEQRRMGASVLKSKRDSKRSSLFESLKQTMIPGSLVYKPSSSTEMKSKTQNPLNSGGNDEAENGQCGVELSTMSDVDEFGRDRGRSMTQSHQLTETVDL